MITGAALLLASGPGCNEGDTVVAPTLTVVPARRRPAAGRVPLSVAFNLNVSGAQGNFAVAVSYGDGASGTSPDQPHTYAAPGTFTATFTVKTTLQSVLVLDDGGAWASAAPDPAAGEPAASRPSSSRRRTGGPGGRSAAPLPSP